MVYFLVLGLVNMIVFCRPGDRKWRVAVIPNTIANSDDLSTLIFFKGNLYVLCFVDHRQLLVEKRQVGRGRDDIILKITPLEVTLDCSQFPYIGGYSCSGERYFLESDEELFMIDLMCLNKRGYNHRAVSVHVARLDFSEMSWKEVSSLGDTVLFLGENSNACCSASELGLSKGCLFYTYPQDQYLYKFDVEDKCITTILPCLELPTPFFALNWIMMPIPIADGVGSMENVSGEVRQEDYLIKAKQTDEIMSEGESGNHGKKQTGEELEKAIPWVVVNEDIVDSIASHLHPVDFLHFRSVCKVSKVPIRKQTSGAIRTTYLTPWLLFSTEKHTVYNFVDPMHNNEKYLMELPELLVGAIIRSQKGGWLLMSKVGGMQYAKDYFDTKCWKNCIWLEPNWSRSTSQELTWLGSNLP
ncbi:uncharacterized protein LOC113309181 isoform X2 [Papaver somniferum]|uniref:uncharacterized protein LOC113309181 isoform X2 n=1 Tax=Papaver somniferum TaxID=3469 RepID=UPI000E6F8C71|nr:uncharacterized protein LOC113309181 isoform X2 [Papaver somniferum]XP_026413375.1 uncharacterized protein LOC113309181 isoform X2 [Papaver somniferum]